MSAALLIEAVLTVIVPGIISSELGTVSASQSFWISPVGRLHPICGAGIRGACGLFLTRVQRSASGVSCACCAGGDFWVFCPPFPDPDPVGCWYCGFLGVFPFGTLFEVDPDSLWSTGLFSPCAFEAGGGDSCAIKFWQCSITRIWSGLCPRWFVDIPTANWCKNSAVSCAFVGGPRASDISDFDGMAMVWEEKYLFEVFE